MAATCCIGQPIQPNSYLILLSLPIVKYDPGFQSPHTRLQNVYHSVKLSSIPGFAPEADVLKPHFILAFGASSVTDSRHE